MDMLKSEVKLLLLRNSQLESENSTLHTSEVRLKHQLYNERQLCKVLERVKVAQNEYINKLNALLIELTLEPNGADGGGGGQGADYQQLRTDINNCVNVCKRLQSEYESCKQSLLKSYTTSATGAASAATTTTTTTSVSTNSTAIGGPVPPGPSVKSLDSTQTSVDESEDNDMLGTDVSQEDTDDDLDDSDEDDDDQEMPELDLIDLQMDGMDGNGNHSMGGADEEEEEDDDPNGAGEGYLDMTDMEFIPKRTLPKGARKSFPNGGGPRLMMSPPKRRKTDKTRGFKTSQKFGDKFRCNWPDCMFISSYKQNVERHYRVHTGERPFKCQFKDCSFSASQAGNLKVHQTRHGHQTPNAHKIRVKSTHNAVRAMSESPNSKSK